jgi:YjbE family integral membrane protein
LFSIGALLQILLIDIVLSGDNAVVIGMAARSLPPEQRKKAIFWGGAAAIALRVAATALIAVALAVPLLEAAGGLLLIWISLKLLAGTEEQHHVRAAGNMKDAVLTIVLADLVMSLDNMLAVGGAARGHLGLLLIGLLMSMAIILFASGIIASLMNRFGWLVYVGAGILAWTAVGMILKDPLVARFFAPRPPLNTLIQALVTAAVLVTGYMRRRPTAAAPT